MILVIVLLILIAILIIIIREYWHLHSVNPTTDILLAGAPDKDQLDLMVKDGYPIIITDKIQDNLSLKDLALKIPEKEITYSYKTKAGENTIKMKDIEKHKEDILLFKNTEITKEANIDPIINTILSGFDRRFVYYPETNIYSHIISKDTRIPLRKNTEDTNLIIVMEGYIRVFLVSPLYNENLYEVAGTTPIDIWDPDNDKKYPKYSKTKIASDNVHEKEILYIPPKWWYAIYSPGTSYLVQVQRENILSQYI